MKSRSLQVEGLIYLAANANNVNASAKQLGVSRQRIYALLKKHNIDK